jgi:hypothetical protein
MRKGLIIAALVFGFATPVFASQCPKDMKAISTALETAKLSAEDKAKIEALLKTGEEQHKAGKHAESVTTLGEAKGLLGL